MGYTGCDTVGALLVRISIRATQAAQALTRRSPLPPPRSRRDAPRARSRLRRLAHEPEPLLPAPDARMELKRAEQLLRLEQQAEEARFLAELRARAARQRDESGSPRIAGGRRRRPDARPAAGRGRSRRRSSAPPPARHRPLLAPSTPRASRTPEPVRALQQWSASEAPTPTTSGSTRPRT